MGEIGFDFEKLKVYQKALDYLDKVYLASRDFPKSELYGLTSQFQRASQSIALNIAEGSGGSKAQFKNYLRIARSSTRECVVCITIAKRQSYLSDNIYQEFRLLLIEISKMISGLMKSLN